MGVGLLAACLPTIRFLFKGLSPESVINSIRSALSLHSLRSVHSRIPERSTQYGNMQDVESNKSQTGILASDTEYGTSKTDFPMASLGGTSNC